MPPLEKELVALIDTAALAVNLSDCDAPPSKETVAPLVAVPPPAAEVVLEPLPTPALRLGPELAVALAAALTERCAVIEADPPLLLPLALIAAEVVAVTEGDFVTVAVELPERDPPPPPPVVPEAPGEAVASAVAEEDPESDKSDDLLGAADGETLCEAAAVPVPRADNDPPPTVLEAVGVPPPPVSDGAEDAEWVA